MTSRTNPFPTSTLAPGGSLVPWLAATGLLAYSPEAPPAKDYAFQYGWVLPGILNPDSNPRRHYFFGAAHRDDARELFAFWAAARKGDVERICLREGIVELDRVFAPIAIYRWQPRRGPAVLFIQHGSYQWVDLADQPRLGEGTVRLYRGIQRARVFRCPGFGTDALPCAPQHLRTYFVLLGKILTDSLLSFNSAHDRVKRCETGHIRDGTWLTDELARSSGLPIDGEATALWAAAHASYSLARWVAENKFGPHYAVFETPADNIRLTTFFAGEHEVRVIDPRRLVLVEALGCRARGLGPEHELPAKQYG